MPDTFSKKPCREHAQGIVEFAIVLPALLLVMFGIIELGRLLAIYASVATASREAARYASAAGRSPRNVPYYQDCLGMRAAAQRMGILVGIAPGNITINYDHGPNTGAPFGSCPSGFSTSTVNATLGDRVIIGVVAQYQPLLGLVGLPVFPMQSQTARTIIREVRIKGTPQPLFPTLTSLPSSTAVLNQPVVTIFSPAEGAVFNFGSTITFSGSAIDVPDGDISSRLVWTSSIDGGLNSGPGFSLTTLSSGIHTIVAWVKDSDGKTGSATVTILVLPFTTATLTDTPRPTETSTPTQTLTSTFGPSPTSTETPTSTATFTLTPTSTLSPTPGGPVTPSATFTNTPVPCQIYPGTYTRVGTKITWSLMNNGPFSYTLSRLTLPWRQIGGMLDTVEFGTVTLWPGDDLTEGSTFGPSTAEFIWTPTTPDFSLPSGPGTFKDFGFFWSKDIQGFTELTIAVFINDTTGTNCSVSIIFY